MAKIYIEELKLKNNLSPTSYLNNIAFVKKLKKGETIKFDNSVTFFIGENGSGKSTILEALAVHMGFNAEGGSKNFCFSTRATEYELANSITVSRKYYPEDGFFFRAESFYNVATNIEELGFPGYGETSLHEQSHGESFISLILNRFSGKGLYILDEPEAALSPTSQMTLISCMANLVENESQFIISTHSPIILAYPNATIYEVSTEGIKKVEYKETHIYSLYKSFLDCPERILKHLI